MNDVVWALSHRADREARLIADRHYNRQKIGSPQFVPPGRCLVLLAPGPALWVTSWPFAEFTRHAWAGAWVNSCFRREGGDVLASELIRQAVAVTRWRWPDVPELGMVTFVDSAKVARKRDPGRCYLRAGFRVAGETKGGLVALQLAPSDMPAPSPPTLGGLFSAACPAVPAAWTAQLHAERARDEMRDALEGARNEIARLRSALAAHEGRTT